MMGISLPHNSEVLQEPGKFEFSTKLCDVIVYLEEDFRCHYD